MTLYENGHVDIYGGVGGYGYQHVGMYERNGNTIYIYEFGNSPNPDNANWKLTASEDGRILTSTEEEGETVFHETVRSYERQPHKQTPPDNVLPTESTK